MTKIAKPILAVMVLSLMAATCAADARVSTPAQPLVLKSESFRHYVEDFDKNDNARQSAGRVRD